MKRIIFLLAILILGFSCSEKQKLNSIPEKNKNDSFAVKEQNEFNANEPNQDALVHKVEIETLKLNKAKDLRELPSEKMNYPIIKTGNNEIDSLINFDLKNKFTSNEYPEQSIESSLNEWIGEQVVYIDFDVSYNKNGILSVQINAEGCGAYCTHWTDYFNYSTITGKPVDISEIIDISGDFKNRIFKDKEAIFKKERLELKELQKDSEVGLDPSTYEWVLENYKNCENSFDLTSFAIYPEHIEINKDCQLPNAIKAFSPEIILKYKYDEIQKYLKMKKLQ